MATYKQIQAYVLRHYGFIPKTCWIAHVKKMSGQPVKRAWNRRGIGRKVPCPPGKVEPIREALRQMGEEGERPSPWPSPRRGEGVAL